MGLVCCVILCNVYILFIGRGWLSPAPAAGVWFLYYLCLWLVWFCNISYFFNNYIGNCRFFGVLVF